jgi:hypothetical protein
MPPYAAGYLNVCDPGGYATPKGVAAWRRLLRMDGLHRLDIAGMARQQTTERSSFTALQALAVVATRVVAPFGLARDGSRHFPGIALRWMQLCPGEARVRA